MTAVAPAADLVEQADRRARVAALLGRLLVAEPGPDVAPLVRGIRSFAPLASGDPALTAEYERLLLREVPLYESVFLGDDGQRGGEVAARVADAYSAAGFEGAASWRVAGPDHLGVELLAYAHVCATEAAAWRDDEPHVAARAVDTARAFLGDHLGQWAEIAMAAVARRAGGPYADLAGAVSAFVAAEAERLRHAPDHPGVPDVAVDPPPDRAGPARLARWLLSPARSGAYLGRDDLAAAAHALGIPWRPSDPRSRFRQVVEDAADGGDLAVLLDALRPAIDRWHAFHAEREAARDGDRRTWRTWRLRAEATRHLLDAAARRQPSRVAATGPVVVNVTGHALAVDVVARLRTLDAVVAVTIEVEPRLTAMLRNFAAAGADDIVLEGANVVASRGAGSDLGGTDIVVRVDGADPAVSRVDFDPADDRPLADAARRAVADLRAGEAHP